jgi:hypothetical protein
VGGGTSGGRRPTLRCGIFSRGGRES